jgi:hypothetical protein
MSYTYQESLDQAERDLQAAREALPRDCAQAIASAGWAEFLRASTMFSRWSHMSASCSEAALS